jgi:pimeloyl-ACP methyl ester carboxylesterase
MSDWRELQRSMLEDLKANGPLPISEQRLQIGGVSCIMHVREGANPLKAVVLVHGTFVNEEFSIPLAKNLAYFGYRCISIPMPGHGINSSEFSMGLLAEQIGATVGVLRQYGCARVAAVGHSLGGVGILFALSGYSQRMERELFSAGVTFSKHADALATASVTHVNMEKAVENYVAAYTQLKSIILQAAQNQNINDQRINAVVLMGLPPDLKKALPGIGLLLPLKRETIKRITEAFVDLAMVRTLRKEGLQFAETKSDSENVTLVAFKTSEPHLFLEYWLHMKEPADFLELLEALVALRDNKQGTLIKYYLEKYVKSVPKLFIYARWDIFSLNFLSGRRHRAEKMYLSCGTATNLYLKDADHMLAQKRALITSEWGTNSDSVAATLDFLDRTLGA